MSEIFICDSIGEQKWEINLFTVLRVKCSPARKRNYSSTCLKIGIPLENFN